MIAYKFLRPDGTGVFTRFAWPLPANGPGGWVHARIDPCRSGIHACRTGDLPLWLGRDLYARDGPQAYHAERAHQVAWLADRLGL